MSPPINTSEFQPPSRVPDMVGAGGGEREARYMPFFLVFFFNKTTRMTRSPPSNACNPYQKSVPCETRCWLRMVSASQLHFRADTLQRHARGARQTFHFFRQFIVRWFRAWIAHILRPLTRLRGLRTMIVCSLYPLYRRPVRVFSSEWIFVQHVSYQITRILNLFKTS